MLRTTRASCQLCASLLTNGIIFIKHVPPSPPPSNNLILPPPPTLSSHPLHIWDTLVALFYSFILEEKNRLHSVGSHGAAAHVMLNAKADLALAWSICERVSRRVIECVLSVS